MFDGERGPAPAPATRRYGDRREAVLASAAALFNERGVKGATLADIAARVGLATNSVTYYYRKKEDLAAACMLRTVDAFQALIGQAAAEGSAAERVRRWFALHFERLAEIEAGRQPPLVAFNDVRALPGPQAETLFAAYTGMWKQLRGLLSGPGSAGLGRAALNARAHLLLAQASYLRHWAGRHDPAEYPRLAARLADVMLGGFAPPGATWPAAEVEAAEGWRLAGASEADAAQAEAFLRAATVLVNDQGYRGASVDRISARLRVTKGSFYHHHDTKEDLVLACFERSFGAVRAALDQAAVRPGTAWQRLVAASAALVRFQLDADGPLLRFSAISALPDAERRGRVREQLQRLTLRLAGLVSDGVVDGSIRPLDAQVGAEFVYGAINAATELRLWVPEVTADDAAPLYLRPVLLGLFEAPAHHGPS